MTDTRKGIGTIAVGAVLLIAAVAGFIVVQVPSPDCAYPTHADCIRAVSGLSPILYYAVRITTWGLLIVGALTVAVGLIRYARREAVPGV
jgi:hypothetical protein